MINATYNVPSALVAPSLGRNLAAGPTATARVELIEPGTEFGERMNQIDARIAKTFRLGTSRVQAQFDIYNLLNVGPSIRPNTNYGSAFLDPIVFLPGRMLKFGVQMDF
jgi:outer membrane receptor protein involved in Fe transport